MIVSQARGVILLSGKRCGLEIFGYTPLQVKSAVCGYGHAQKEQVLYMVKQLLNISVKPKCDDISDALAIAICHGNTHRFKSKI